MWPCQVWLGFASQAILTAWPNGEFADLGLVEVGANLNSVQIGDVEQVFAGRDEVVAGDGDGVDGSGEGRADIVVGVAVLCRGEGCARIGELGFGPGAVGGAVALGAARVKASDGSFRRLAAAVLRRRLRWRRRRLSAGAA